MGYKKGKNGEFAAIIFVLAQFVAVWGVAAVGVNSLVALNILWIPKFGIAGAAWASTVSYTISFLGSLFFYCRLSGNRWMKVLLPQRSDWAVYWHTEMVLGRWAKAKLRVLL
ncbi:MAG: polysaccharide biosynthesis C-terminal domain-containing protein [Candidatus Hadarchaeum sp.]|uniref:polysaccharide biosynthesis C-terminal domain-containing protein n=1 Tax=Candidatus Hadarchaeum sp. TaxID=2883567 RepID=UPI00316B328B